MKSREAVPRPNASEQRIAVRTCVGQPSVHVVGPGVVEVRAQQRDRGIVVVFLELELE